MTTVLLCGDSHLAEGSARGITKLGPRLAGAGHEVTYVARGGWDTRAARDAIDLLPEAKVTIFCFGSNDAAPWKQVPLDEFSAGYRELLRLASGRSIVLGPPPVIERGSGARARTNAVIASYAEAARRASGEAGAVFVSLMAVIQGDGSHHVEDGLHLNDAAYEAITASVVH